MNKNRMEGVTDQGERANDREALVVNGTGQLAAPIPIVGEPRNGVPAFARTT